MASSLLTHKTLWTDRFPYGVLYQIRKDHLLVTAIMHLKSNTKRWRDRMAKT
jgi:hypothetical protein